jgi:hypothetical protein
MARGLFSGWGGRQGVRLQDAVRACAVAEARLAVLRLRSGDWAGAYLAAQRAEGEAALVGWASMVRAAERLQARAVADELEARAEYDDMVRRASWGLF